MPPNTLNFAVSWWFHRKVRRAQGSRGTMGKLVSQCAIEKPWAQAGRRIQALSGDEWPHGQPHTPARHSRTGRALSSGRPMAAGNLGWPGCRVAKATDGKPTVRPSFMPIVVGAFADPTFTEATQT